MWRKASRSMRRRRACRGATTRRRCCNGGSRLPSRLSPSSRGAAEDDARQAQRPACDALVRPARRRAALPAMDAHGASAEPKSGALTVAIGQPDELANCRARRSLNTRRPTPRMPTSAERPRRLGQCAARGGQVRGGGRALRHAADLTASMRCAQAQHDHRLPRSGRLWAEAAPSSGQLLMALGALSDYLAWTTDGGPYDQHHRQDRRGPWRRPAMPTKCRPSRRACARTSRGGERQRSEDRADGRLPPP